MKKQFVKPAIIAQGKSTSKANTCKGNSCQGK